MTLALFALFALFADPAPTAAQAAEVGRAVADLASPRFAVREAAQKALIAAGRSARSALTAAARASRDEEVRARATVVLEKIHEADLEWLRPLPEIDAYWFDSKEKCYGPPIPALDVYLVARGRDFHPWKNYFLAHEDLVRDQLRAGVLPRLLRFTLAELHGRDAVFFKTWGCDGTPPAVDPGEYLRAGFRGK